MDDEKYREEDLLGFNLSGEHPEFTQLHHALNRKQKGRVSQDCHSKLDDEKYREEDLLGFNLSGEHPEFTQLHLALNLKQKETMSQDCYSSKRRTS